MLPNAKATAVTNQQSGNPRWLTGQLLDAIQTERRLLHGLGRMVQQQRAAISAEDHEALHDATFGIERILQTLSEASRRPRIIHRQLGGGDRVSLTALVESLGILPPSELLAARNDLREAARVLEDEVRANRALVAEALAKH